tara:strand:+ start:47264 stop:48184 length:921 start_codon:yes stop_codon:yes gene_type:complete
VNWGYGKGFISSGKMALLMVSALSVAFSATPVSSATSTCDVPPSSDWSNDSHPGDFLSIDSVGGNGVPYSEEQGDAGLRPLENGLSTEWSDGVWSGFPGVEVSNGSATIISMVLVPGYSYTFCVDFSGKGDIYLLTDSNLVQYEIDYGCRGEWFANGRGEFDYCSLDQGVPVEWRDLVNWIPFRDSHAYESVSYEEFSVAIDSSGPSWSFGGLLDDSEYQVFHLVLDGWDNSRPGDAGAHGDMSIEVLIDVESRQTLPNYTAYIVIGSLPLSCIIIPMILHARYHSSFAEDGDSGEVREVPFLKDG